MLRRVISTTIMLLISALIVVAVPSPGRAAAGLDKDCSDFATQAAAQNFFLDHGGPQSDPHRLDADGDGIACESNPCPCSTDTTPDDPPPPPPPPTKQGIRVVRVLDGETVKVRLPDGRRPVVRMIGANAPTLGRCGSNKAMWSLRKMLPVGTRVRLLDDPRVRNADGQGRLWRYVHKDGRDTNRRQVVRGWARVYKSPFARRASYLNAQAGAKAAPRGMWRFC